MAHAPLSGDRGDPMRCLAVCQNELVVRMLDEILLPDFELAFLVESKPLARRLHDAGMHVTAADPRRTDTYLKAEVTRALSRRERRRDVVDASDLISDMRTISSSSRR